MDYMVVKGGKPLHGTITISGAKNAALPILAACLLSEKPLTIKNIPFLSDITCMLSLLREMGVDIHMDGTEAQEGHLGRVLKLSAAHIQSKAAPYELVRKMRASILVLGPLLARFGYAKISLPGGCAIGTRPIDFHVAAMEALGAKVRLEDGYIIFEAPKGLQGNEIVFPKVTVTGTKNAMMAAVLAQGQTTIMNAAQEPEVSDLATCLCSMGACIEGLGTNILKIQGVSSLKEASHSIMPDRTETGTYILAAAMTQGNILLRNTCMDFLALPKKIWQQVGILITEEATGYRITTCGQKKWRPVDIITEPFPGFPTDLQAQHMALMCCVPGASTVTETIFDNRFMHVAELHRLGADIHLQGNTATIRGGIPLKGAPVMATDLRASVALVLAGLVAEGETTINRIYHLDRGYENIEEKLRACGADIQRKK